MLRLRLFAAIPLCALAGCATVKTRAAEPPVATESTVAAPGGQGVVPAGSHSEAGQPGTVTVVEEGPVPVEGAAPAPSVPAPEAVKAPSAEAAREEKVRLVPAGVFAAALQAAVMVTGPASTSGRFWDELLTPTELGRSIVKRSIELVGARKLGRGVPNDCSGFVRLAYLAAGIDLVAHGFLAGENAVSAIFRRALAVGTVHHQPPRPGDLVFFRETYDRNRDGRRNDGMTHIGVVESVDADGTVTFIHRGGKGVARGRLNLSAPTKHQLGQGGPVLNDYIRPAAKGTRAYLAGELFAAFASPEGL
ncbi:CHAP domain-containing protein [Myxococcus sp. RHSTA-1-4]|uniref:CHAP domain-containing protein n=1 Tax=Myxococcus sp. RHSTA-1-4 TaxID=2874601 RepID=UPI001CBDB417|nr:CHAP domain-containing protein [Myxococcus sp. RHSTA-1-4]